MRPLLVLSLLALAACAPATDGLRTDIGPAGDDFAGRAPGVVPIVEPAGAF